jgi:hypothetical protein
MRWSDEGVERRGARSQDRGRDGQDLLLAPHSWPLPVPRLQFTVARMLAATAWVAAACAGLALALRVVNVNRLPLAERPVAVLQILIGLALVPVGAYLAVATLLGRAREAYARLFRFVAMLVTALAIIFLVRAMAGVASLMAGV